MNYIELTYFLVSSIVDKAEDVNVKEFETDEDFILVKVFVDSSDVGRVVGKQGKTANAIRTLVQASMHSNYQRIKIDFQSYED